MFTINLAMLHEDGEKSGFEIVKSKCQQKKVYHYLYKKWCPDFITILGRSLN